eukprot:scpid95716/ scgid18250/ 
MVTGSDITAPVSSHAKHLGRLLTYYNDYDCCTVIACTYNHVHRKNAEQNQGVSVFYGTRVNQVERERVVMVVVSLQPLMFSISAVTGKATKFTKSLAALVVDKKLKRRLAVWSILP